MGRREFRDLDSPAEARAAIDSLSLGGGVEHVDLAAATGRVLAERIDADLDVPGFDRAALDGYALQAADTFGADEADPARLTVVGTVHAGEEPAVSVASGEAVEISTGAVMPPGTDAMVPVERTDTTDETVAIRTSVPPGGNVMVAGADVAAGERALGPGRTLTPRDVGLLAALGVAEVPVTARPRVGIVSTGEELVRPGERVAHDRGQIYDVNSYAIAAAVEDAGGDARLYPHAGDDEAALERILREAAAECDLVCSSGSTSASAVDVVYRVIEQGGELLCHGVAIKPGKPMLVGRFADAAYVGLPGYPVSAMMVFRTFVAPAIREAAGGPSTELATVTGRMGREQRSEQGRHRLLPVGIVETGQGDSLIYPVDKGSGATTSLADADGVVSIPAETDYLTTGDEVTVELFTPALQPPTLLGVGEPDPRLDRALDSLEQPRYLSVGSRQGLRWLRDGVPDVAVVAGPLEPPAECVELAHWEREWGLLTDQPAPNGLTDLIDRELRYVNLSTETGLRGSFDAALEQLAADRATTKSELTDSIDGYEFAVRGLESPARRVERGVADVGLGLASTADRLGLAFTAIGSQPVCVVADPDRIDKDGVAALKRELESA